MWFPLGREKIWRGGLSILDISTQSKSLKIKWIQALLNPTNTLWKDFLLYRLNLILNTNQGLPLFRQKQILRSNRHKNLQKQSNEDFFIQLLNAWLHFTIFLRSHTKLNFSYDKWQHVLTLQYILCIHAIHTTLLISLSKLVL